MLAHLQSQPGRSEDDQEKPRSQGKREEPEVVDEGRFTRKKMSPLRRKIAAQLVMSQQTTATLTTFNECDMSEVMALRKRRRKNSRPITA